MWCYFFLTICQAGAARVPVLAPQCGGWHQSHKEINITRMNFVAVMLWRMLGSKLTVSFSLTSTLYKTFIVLPSLENFFSFFLHIEWNSTFKSSVDKILIENSPTSVFQKPHILSSYELVNIQPILSSHFLPLLGRNLTDTNQVSL